MQNNTVETLMAAAVVAIAIGFVFFAYNSTHSGSVSGYAIDATVNNADAIKAGSDVRLHCVKIGTISSIEMNAKTYKPIVHLTIRDDIHIPVDSSVRIASSGIMNGSVFLAIDPGRSTKMLVAGQAWKPK